MPTNLLYTQFNKVLHKFLIFQRTMTHTNSYNCTKATSVNKQQVPHINNKKRLVFSTNAHVATSVPNEKLNGTNPTKIEP